MTTLRIPEHLIADLDGYAVDAYPQECCGALLGLHEPGESGRIWQVRSLWPAGNVHVNCRSRRYAIAPEDLLQAHKSARQQGEEVVGYYHSHPDSGAAPSPTDLAEAAPGVSYLIIAVNAQAVLERRSWRLRSDVHRFDEEALA